MINHPKIKTFYLDFYLFTFGIANRHSEKWYFLNGKQKLGMPPNSNKKKKKRSKKKKRKDVPLTMSTAMPFKVYGSQLRLQVIIAIACCSPSESKDHPAIKDAPDSLV